MIYIYIYIYMKGYSMHEEHRANLENTRNGKQRET